MEAAAACETTARTDAHVLKSEARPATVTPIPETFTSNGMVFRRVTFRWENPPPHDRYGVRPVDCWIPAGRGTDVFRAGSALVS